MNSLYTYAISPSRQKLYLLSPRPLRTFAVLGTLQPLCGRLFVNARGTHTMAGIWDHLAWTDLVVFATAAVRCLITVLATNYAVERRPRNGFEAFCRTARAQCRLAIVADVDAAFRTETPIASLALFIRRALRAAGLLTAVTR